MGVSLSIYSSVTRLLNSPLLSVTTTAVAAAVGRSEGAAVHFAGLSFARMPLNFDWNQFLYHGLGV